MEEHQNMKPDVMNEDWFISMKTMNQDTNEVGIYVGIIPADERNQFATFTDWLHNWVEVNQIIPMEFLITDMRNEEIARGGAGSE